MKKSTACLWGVIAFLSGVIIGFLISPVKQGIGNNSGNNSCNGSGNSNKFLPGIKNEIID